MASNKDKQNIELTKEAHRALAIVKAMNYEVKTMADAVLFLVANQK